MSWHHENWNTFFYGISAFSALATLGVIGWLSYEANRIAGSLLGLETKRTSIETRPQASIIIKNTTTCLINPERGWHHSERKAIFEFVIQNLGHKCKVTKLFYEIYNERREPANRTDFPDTPFDINKGSESKIFIMESPPLEDIGTAYYKVTAELKSIDTSETQEISASNM
jgi:hypothetical protein